MAHYRSADNSYAVSIRLPATLYQQVNQSKGRSDNARVKRLLALALEVEEQSSGSGLTANVHHGSNQLLETNC